MSSLEGILAHPMINHPSIAKFQQFVELKDYRPPAKKEYVRYVRKCSRQWTATGPITFRQSNRVR